MIEDIPRGWGTVKLAQITIKVGSGATPRGGSESYQQAGIPLIRSMNVRFEGFTEDGLAFLDRQQADALKEVTVRSGDVLLNITGASIGRVTQAPPHMDGARVNQHVCIIRADPEVDAEYLARYLASPSVQQMIWTEQYGVTRQALTKSQILSFEIPLPPTAEQRRIVAQIDQLLVRVNRVRDRLSRISAILKRFRQAVLAAACSGRLTEDWRDENPNVESAPSMEEPIKKTPKRRAGRLWGAGVVPELTDEQRESLPDSWTWAKVRDLGQDPEGTVQVGPMSMRSKDFADRGVPVLNVGCVQWGHFDESKLDYMPPDIAASFERYRIDKGDVLFTRSGTVGRCAVATDKQHGYLMTFHLLRVRSARQKCLPEYLQMVFQGANSIRKQTEEAAIGSTRAGFNTNLLADLDVPLPPLTEQREIVRRVNALLRVDDAIENRVAKAASESGKLTQAILAKAFRGELVPNEAELARSEGREYEPASVLLERIREERKSETAPKAKHLRKRSERSLASAEGH
jgi:type I restriction enzyme, S subunit